MRKRLCVLQVTPEKPTQNPKFMRPEEPRYLKGDPSKARDVLGWKSEYTFESMLEEMIERWEREL